MRLFRHFADDPRAKRSGHHDSRSLRVEQLEQRQVFSAIPLTFTQQGSEGWMILDAQATGQVRSSADMRYTANVTAGQALSFSIYSPDSAMNVWLLDPNGQAYRQVTASVRSVGYTNPIIANATGTWTFVVTGSASLANFNLEVALNAGLEGKDSSDASTRPMNVSVTTVLPGVARYAFIGTSELRNGQDQDVYAFELKNRVGKSIAIELSGWGGQNLSSSKLELLDPNGVVRAIASSKSGDSSTLEIPNYLVDANGTYTLRLTSKVAGKYSVVVVDGVSPDKITSQAVLNALVDQRLVVPTTVQALVNTLTFDRVYQSMGAEELIAALVANKLVVQIGDAASLRAILASTRSIDLDQLRPDGILTALATLDGGSYLRSGSTKIDAPQAKTLLANAFQANRVAFLNVFSPESLVRLFDDSIGPGGANADPIRVLVDKPVAPGYANILVAAKPWISDPADPSTFPTPSSAVAVTNAMPDGYKTLVFFSDFMEVAGYGTSHNARGGYIDPVNASGQKTTNFLVWMDRWQAEIKKRMGDFLTEYKRLGGKLDYVLLDMEDTMLHYGMLAQGDRRVDKSKPGSVGVWEELLADPRWPALKVQMVARGIPESELTLDKIGKWNYSSDNATRWNAVMSERRTAYMNSAITDTILALYPNAIVSNYSDAFQTQTIAAERHSFLTTSYFSLGAPVGNAQARSIYADDPLITTPSGVSAPQNQFDARIKTIDFTPIRDSQGKPTQRGTVKITFFEPVNGVSVGQKIAVQNRGETSWIDPRYAGTFTVASISSDRRTITYTLTLQGSTMPASYDLSDRSGAFYTAYVDFLRTYERFVAEVKTLRSQVAASSMTLIPWISNPDWLKTRYGVDYPHYSEALYHAVLSGADTLAWWKQGFDTQPANTQLVSKLTDEVSALVGFSDRKTISFNDPGWNDGYVITGMEANGRRVYRLTPDPSVSMTVLSSSGTVRVKIGDKVIEVPNASIYTPTSPASTLGIWIIQTKGTTSLNGTTADVLQQLAAAMRPTVSGASVGLVGQATQLTLSTNSSLVPAGTLVSFDVDWNGDGKTDRTYVGTNQVIVSANYPTVGLRNVRVQATIVGTGEQLPLLEFPLRILQTGFVVETSSSDAPVKNLVYTGTEASDTVYFRSAGAGVIDAFVVTNGQSTKYSFSGITGALYAYGLGGDDTLVAADLDIPAFLYGGEGKDTLIGGKRPSQLFGEQGDDILVGMSGTTFFDGGPGNNLIQLGTGFGWLVQGSNVVLGGQNYAAIPQQIAPAISQVLASMATRAAAAALPATKVTAAAAGMPGSERSASNVPAVAPSSRAASVDSVLENDEWFEL
jgi:hypothetical protein